MTEQDTLTKLIVLYMLKKIDFSMTYSQIADFVLGKGYTDGFTLQACVNQMSEDDLIHPETLRGTTYYSITPEGEQTVDLIRSKISIPIREDIVSYLKENKVQLRNESNIRADYYRTTTGEYQVHCYIREKDYNLLDLTLTVMEAAQARAITENWKGNCQDVYMQLMDTLLKK